MKQIKRFLALVLATAMILSLGNIALAEEKEQSAETHSSNACKACGAAYGGYSRVENVETIHVTRCAHSNNPHNHTRFVEYVYRCLCYNNGSIGDSGTRCPFYGVLSLDQMM